MNTINKADRFFRKIVFLERALGALLLFIMLVICFGAVVMRYVFNAPWAWSEEVILVILVGFGYLCISIDVYNDEHIALTFLYNKLPYIGQRILDVFRHLLLTGFFAVMTYYGWKIYLIKAPKTLAATGWSQGIVFIAQVILTAIAVLFCIMNIIKVFFMKKPAAAITETDSESEAESNE